MDDQMPAPTPADVPATPAATGEAAPLPVLDAAPLAASIERPAPADPMVAFLGKAADPATIEDPALAAALARIAELEKSLSEAQSAHGSTIDEHRDSESDLADALAQLETARRTCGEAQAYAKEIEGRLAESRLETEKAREALAAAQKPAAVVPAKVW